MKTIRREPGLPFTDVARALDRDAMLVFLGKYTTASAIDYYKAVGIEAEEVIEGSRLSAPALIAAVKGAQNDIERWADEARNGECAHLSCAQLIATRRYACAWAMAVGRDHAEEGGQQCE